MCSQVVCLHKFSFLKNPLGFLCTPREVHPPSYVKRCFLTRSPSRAAQSTLDPASWSKINPTHNLQPPPPKVCRQEAAVIIRHLIFGVMDTHTNDTCCFFKIYFLHVSQSNVLSQSNRMSTITKCHESLTPQTLFVASDLSSL